MIYLYNILYSCKIQHFIELKLYLYLVCLKGSIRMDSIKKKIRLRLILYAFALLVIFLYLFLSEKGVSFYCLFNKLFLIECPSCGATRAFFSFLKGDFKAAYAYNPVFTAVFYPIGIMLILQDFICCVCSLISKKEYISMLDFIAGGKR